MTTDEDTEVFSFTQLSDKAKEAAINRYAAPEYEWWDSECEFRKEDGKEKGFLIDDIYFSGFHSQGDGASWDGSIDVVKWLELKRDASEGRDYVKYDVLAALAQEGWIEDKIAIATRGSYSHEGTMYVPYYPTASADDGVFMTEESPYKGASVAGLIAEYANDAAFEEVVDEMLESARNYARKIYSALEAEYESYFEEENFAALAEANDWKFDEDGGMV